ncbi:hypothetical protein MJH12_16440, partial [bacterium]|nr:hypothetical protein [bacterium]
SQVEKVLLGLVNANQLALISIASVLPTNLNSQLKTLLLPKILKWAAKGQKQQLSLFAKYAPRFLMFGALSGIVLSVGSPWFIHFVYGEKFAQAEIYSSMLAFLFSFRIFELFGTSCLSMSSLLPLFNRYSRRISICKIICALILIPQFGAIGYIILLLGMEIIKLFGLIYYIKLGLKENNT